MKPRLVIVGNGMAGVRALEELLKRAPERYEITVLGAEPHGAYNRIMLSPVLAGEKQVADIVTHPPGWYAERGVRLLLGVRVTHIDRTARRLETACGRTLDYDRLLLATGSRPFIPAWPGRELPGVVGFREIADVDTMLAAASEHRHAVVVGGGVLGLEAASALAGRGMHTTVVHRSAVVMERQLDREGAALLQAALEQRGIHFELSANTRALLGDARVRALQLDDGRELPADLVVVAAGIVPDTALARAAQLHCERGVVVDDALASSDPAIFAVGECAQHRGQCYGLVAPLFEQARIWAARMADDACSDAYAGSVVSAKLKVTGIDVFSVGDFFEGEGRNAIVLRDPARGVYRKLLVANDRLAGAVLYGDIEASAWYLDLIRSGECVARLRSQLLFGPEA